MTKSLVCTASVAAIALCGCATPTRTEPPAAFMPVATVLELMESTIAHAAEEYWNAVQVVVDESGVHEDFPETDEEWEEVWAAGMTIAESGNLLMMAPRAVDSGAWMQFSRALVEAGVEAAAAAINKDAEQVFAAGEVVYNVCTGCHARYIPE
jgi:leucyl-tRNA synthetase